MVLVVLHTMQIDATDRSIFSRIHRVGRSSDVMSYEDQWEEMGVFSFKRINCL